MDAIAPPAGRIAAPAYTWQKTLSQVRAYVYRDSAHAYDRAATAWAFNASMPAPPPRPAHDAGDSRGTTPLKYRSSGRMFTARDAPFASRTASRLPR